MHPFLKSLFLITVVLLLSACGVSRKTADFSSEKMPDKKDVKALETGISSWYGPKFHGRLTANGETYDMDGITAAHRTLPFGTILLVENLDNGKTVQVRVNDRGPYAKNRIIDLSRGAAKRIDMIGPGTARVRLYLIDGDLENSRITDLKVPTYTVQLGSFENKAEAERLSSKIKGSRIENYTVNGKPVFRLFYGLYTDAQKAEKEKQRLSKSGYSGFVKQIENN